MRFAKDSIEYKSLPIKSDVPKKALSQPLFLMNKGNESANILLFGSTLFTLDSRPKTIDSNCSENADAIYYPSPDIPDNLSVYGFAVAINTRDHTFHAVQLRVKPLADFMVFPAPTSDGPVLLDFGQVLVGGDASEFIKSLVLFNMYQVSYSWTFKLSSCLFEKY